MAVLESLVDLLRASHLICFAAGMGTSLYFDMRSLRTIDQPVTKNMVADFYAFHRWITAAFVGLWITGLILVYVRTGFAFEQFSPKLWTKLAIMTFMVANALAVAKIVLPAMRDRVGQSMISLPFEKLALLTQIAINSVFCWIAGLALGSSTVLKTAPWDLVVPLFVAAFASVSIGGHALVWLMRQRSFAETSERDAYDQNQTLSLFDWTPSAR